MIHLNVRVVAAIFIYLFIPCINGLFGPISLTVGAGLAAGLGYNFDFVKDHTYCKFTECCNAEYIPGDISKLENELKSNLFGQHIVIQQLVPALRAHFSKDAKSKKALVLSFHGTPGTGKNYVAEFIAKSLFKKGLESKFVHVYKGRADFPIQSRSSEYQEMIGDQVRTALSDCPSSLFIFDEVDKMPHGIFESLTSLVDYNSHIRGTEYNQAIFVFLSNTAGIEISSRLGELMRWGTLRENSKMSDFEKILEMAAYNRDGGMKRASLIEAHVVDHYIPFLPLEKAQVIQCLEAEFRRWGQIASTEAIEEILKSSVSFEKKTGLYATSGCKILEKKVAAHVKTMSGTT